MGPKGPEGDAFPVARAFDCRLPLAFQGAALYIAAFLPLVAVTKLTQASQLAHSQTSSELTRPRPYGCVVA
jgi:hypothetical protein